jgi:hypothetical protein
MALAGWRRESFEAEVAYSGRQVDVAKKRKAIRKMKDRFPDESEAKLGRFLRVKEYHTKEAIRMLEAERAWRATGANNPPAESFSRELAKGKGYFHRTDKSGSPLLIFIPANHHQSDSTAETLNMLIYFIETAISAMPALVESFSILVDFEGYGMQNFDLPFTRAALNLLQNYYPERLGRLYLVSPPFVFRAVWTIVKPLMDQLTRNKFTFISDYEELKLYIDEDCLPRKYGGTSPYEHDPSIPMNAGIIDPSNREFHALVPSPPLTSFDQMTPLKTSEPM